MARIAGVDLPKNKKVEFGLRYVFGIGPKFAKDIVAATGVNPEKRVYELNEDEIAALNKEIQKNYIVEGDLRKQIQMNIKELMDLGCYRGLRHRKGLRVRGQKSKTNARTRKGKKKTVGAGS